MSVRFVAPAGNERFPFGRERRYPVAMSAPSTTDAFELGEAIEALGPSVRGEILLPDDEGYDQARTVWNAMIDLWHLGGAVADVPRNATAFRHRDESFMRNVEANWEDPADDDANVSWAREWFAEVEALSVAAGRYGNFPGVAEDPARSLSGDNWDRLVDVKTRCDPENPFHLNRNVPPRTDDRE